MDTPTNLPMPSKDPPHAKLKLSVDNDDMTSKLIINKRVSLNPSAIAEIAQMICDFLKIDYTSHIFTDSDIAFYETMEADQELQHGEE